jgi:hypothetical protein
LFAVLVALASVIVVSTCAGSPSWKAIGIGSLLSSPVAGVARPSSRFAASPLKLTLVGIGTAWLGFGGWSALHAPPGPHELVEFRDLWRVLLAATTLGFAILLGWVVRVGFELVAGRSDPPVGA